jgi:hypothetical protein
MNLIIGVIFSIVPLSFLFSMVEIIAIGSFFEWSYHLGLVVMRYKIDLKLPLNYDEDKLEFETARVKFLSPTKILFRSKIIMFNMRMNTPFPIKGIIFEKDGETIVEGRIPLGTTIFMGSIFFMVVGGWFIGSLMSGSIGIFFGALALGTVFYFIGKWSLSLEISRARAIVDELCLKLDSCNEEDE